MAIQAALFFILGIAVTSFILILIAPFVWRRMMFFTRKLWRARLPTSIKEAEADKNFLRAQHAVQIARQKERYKLLQRINDEQQRQLERNHQQLQRLSEVEGQADNMQKEVLGYKKTLQQAQNSVDNVRLAHGHNSKEVRELFFREKLTRLDVADYEVNLTTLHKKIDDLHKNYIYSAEKKDAEMPQNVQANNDSTNGAILKDELKNLVATVISSIVQKDEEVNKLLRATAKNKKKGSLADYIHQKLVAKQRED